MGRWKRIWYQLHGHVLKVVGDPLHVLKIQISKIHKSDFVSQNLHSLLSKVLTVALELGYLKGGYVNFGFSILMLQDHCNLL